MSVPQVPPSEPPRVRPPLGVVRGIVAAVGIIIMVFAGGCTILIGGSMLTEGGDGGEYLSIVALLGGVPFLFGALITRLALKVGR